MLTSALKHMFGWIINPLGKVEFPPFCNFLTNSDIEKISMETFLLLVVFENLTLLNILSLVMKIGVIPIGYILDLSQHIFFPDRAKVRKR